MNTRHVFKNAIMAVLQVLVTGLTLFVFYRFLLKTIGVERLGVWSLVLATTSIVHIGNLGLSGSVVKFVSKYVARGELGVAAEVIETAAISVAGGFFVLLAIIYPVMGSLLELGLPTANLADALSVLPFAVVSLWTAVILGVIQSGLDGCLRIDLRSSLATAGAILNFGCAVILVQAYGFIGLGYAQAIQSVLLLAATWMILRKQMGTLRTFPCRWRSSLFAEMLHYGMNFQLISIATMLCEPATKWMMSHFGGLAMTGYYEMASRMVIQFRVVLVAANQVLVPVTAGLEETDPKQCRLLYVKTLRLMLFIAVPYYAAILTAVPLISILWVGMYEWHFVGFSMLLVASAFLNTLVSPAYHAYLGNGRLRWNTWAHVVIAVLNLGLGFLLGTLYGSLGVATGSALALIAGSCIVIIAYHLEEHISWGDVRLGETVWLLPASAIGSGIGLLAYFWFHSSESMPLVGVLMLTVFSLIVLPVVWFHPIRTVLKGCISSK